MAILARATITLAQTVDIDSVTWYYILQASTASAPAKPTTATPSGWSTTEPTYTEGSTNSLYVCQKTTYSDGTFEYSDVSLSSSYEAAKVAYNKSVTANNKAMEAAKVATKYVTDQSDGIFVHPDGQGPNDTNTPTGWRIRDTLEMLRSGVSYIKAWVENNVSKIRIGREDSAHFLMEDGRICGYGDANDAYFETGDAGNVITQTFIGDGENQYFDLYYASEVQSVMVNGTAVTGYTLRSSGLLLELASVPADGAVVMVKYTTSRQTPYFTFGSRRNSDDGGQTILGIGIGSATMGDGLIAPAPFSYAEGTGGVASGIASHAEGGSTRAKGSYAHSEGWETDAAADYSHAGGYMSEALKQSAFAHGHHVKATAQGGLACGQFNRPDSRYMLCVGNGTSDGSRANALMVTKAGSSIFSGRLLSGASATTGEYRSLFLKDSVYKDNISVGAGGVSGSQTVSAAKSGYTPVGVIGYQISNATSGGTNVAPCFPYTFEIADNNIKFNIRNTSSSASKLKITFDVLYIATAAL